MGATFGGERLCCMNIKGNEKTRFLKLNEILLFKVTDKISKYDLIKLEKQKCPEGS